MSPKRGRHRSVHSSKATGKLFGNLRRKLLFGGVGAFTTLVGYSVLYVAVEMLHWNISVAYAVQAVVSIELNFVLNYTITWKDRRELTAWRAFQRFHSAKLFLSVPLHQVLFNGMVWAGVNYLIANTVCIIVGAAINYTLGDRFIFGKSKQKQKLAPTAKQAIAEELERQLKHFVKQNLKAMAAQLTAQTAPKISVVIPTKGNKGQIVETVSALLRQRYPHRLEIIVVGDTHDQTWKHLEGFGNSIRRFAADIVSPGRDANMKRAIGLSRASTDSQILSVMDDDVIPSPTWAADVAVRLQGVVHAVAGPVSGLGNSFWTRYIDKNPAATKMPRISDSFLLNTRLLKSHKPPVTANFAITRAVYEAVGGPDPTFTNSYEDYSWMSVMMERGVAILCDDALACERYHREGFKALLREYLRSGKGAADLVRERYKQCPFARKRLRQVGVFYAILAAAITALVLQPTAVLLSGAIGASLVVAAIAVKVRRLEGLLYPMLSLLLGSAFIAGFTKQLLRLRPLITPELLNLELIVYRQAPRSVDTITEPTVATTMPLRRINR